MFTSYSQKVHLKESAEFCAILLTLFCQAFCMFILSSCSIMTGRPEGTREYFPVVHLPTTQGEARELFASLFVPYSPLFLLIFIPSTTVCNVNANHK